MKSNTAVTPAIGTLTDRQLDVEPKDLSVPLGLSPGEPDYIFHIHVQDGRYYTSAFDAGPRLAWRCTGRTFDMPQHVALVFALTTALESVLACDESDRLCQRYGFRTRRAARQSIRKLQMAIYVTDPELAELGQTIADAPDPRTVLDFLDTADRDQYQPLVRQLQRFETRWGTIAPEHPQILLVQEWAKPLLLTVRHDGEVRSFKTKLLHFPNPQEPGPAEHHVKVA